MILTELKIHFLRNILSAHIPLNPRFNFITGSNGSGKTTILEALYLLSCGHSFRSREISPIITYEQPALTIFARADHETTISIQKSSQHPTQIKLNNQFCYSTSQLAYALPCQIIYSDIFQIIDAGASVRRSLLDWGLFHVKHNYLPLLKEYRKVLKQRNALLKTKAPYEHFIPWDKQLSQLANSLDELRVEYFAKWQDAFKKTLAELTEVECTIEYYKGWDKKNSGRTLEEFLADSFINDSQKLYTQQGAHQADIIIESERNKAKQILSRGQQKIILIALKLSQAEFLDTECLYLIDDLAAELDENHQTKLLIYLSHLKGQFVITNTSLKGMERMLLNERVSFFEINKGIISTVN